jgi:DNA-binding beta-propeller fold protein YncE
MAVPRRSRTVPAVWPRHSRGAPLAVVALLLAGCSVGATPDSPTVPGILQATAGPVGYVVCPDTLTPIELRSRLSESPIPLPVSGTPPLGDYAVAVTPDGRRAFVVTQSTPPGGITSNVLIPVDLATGHAGTPIVLPGHGASGAVVVMHDGRTVLAASGNAIVPVDVATGAVGQPLDLGAGRTVSGMALSPTTDVLYVLVPDGVVPVDTATATAGTPIATGLTVSSVSSPHGLVVSPDGATLWVAGQGPPDFGGRVVPVSTATGAVGTATSFDAFGITDPAALAVTPDGSQLLVADSADNWIVTVLTADPATPLSPVRLPTGSGTASASGADHPTDVVTSPDSAGAFVVTGLGTVLPYRPENRTYGAPIRVCSGATSMAVSVPT